MNKLEDIVNLYDLKTKREKIVSNRQEITHLKKEMSDLKINRDVAIYADALQKVGYGDEIHSYLAIAADLRNDPDVAKYVELKNKVHALEQQIVEYYRSIQIGLRNRLTYTETPDIFVYYGMYGDKAITRHIITNKLAYLDAENTVVMPEKETESRRKARHFYNKVSFRYLEELSKDTSFSLEEKNLGKVKVLKKEVDN